MAVLIVMLINLTGVPTLCIVNRRIYLQILEQRERSTDRNVMVHGILPLAQSGFEQAVVLRTDTVRQTSGIADGNLLIPPFGSCRFLAFEREETAQCDIKVGQCHRNRRIAHCLGDIGSSGQRQSDIGETA